MILLDEPPVATPSPTPQALRRSSGLPAWRFASRLARREVRRRPGRTALVVMLVAIPVMAMTIGSIMARTNVDDWGADFRRDYGTADIVVGLPWISAADPGAAVPDLPPGGTVIGEYLMLSTFLTPADGVPGASLWADVTDLDPTNADEWSAVEVTDGRPPESGEILLDRDLAADLGVDVGDRLELDRPSGDWVVSGFGRIRGDYWRRLAVIPGFDAERIVPEQRFVTKLIDLPDSVSPEEATRLASERGGISRFEDPFCCRTGVATGMAWGYVAGVLALVAVGIIVAAAFATSARRQLVTIGQLAANGASPAVVRRSLALQGTWTGLVGAVVGVGIGVALVPIARPIVAEHILQHELRSTRFAISDLVVVVVTATVIATIAAAVPARSAARVPVMAALAGRRPTGAPPAWLVPTGLALFGSGLGLVAVAALGASGSSGNSNTWAGLVVLGATGIVFGMCCASPLVIERIGRLGRTTTLSWRMALRSLVRSRARSAAIVASIAVTAGMAVAGAAVAESAIRSNYACCDPTLPFDTVRIDSYVPTPFAPGGGMVDPGPLEPFVAPDIVDEMLRVIDADTVFPVLAATFDPVPFDPDSNYIANRGPIIATPDLLDLLGLHTADERLLTETGAIGAQYFGAVVSDGEASNTMSFESEDGLIDIEFHWVSHQSEVPWFAEVMMTEEAARSAGFDIVPIGIVARTGAPLDDDQRAIVRDVQQALDGRGPDAFIEPGDGDRTLAERQLGGEPAGVMVSYEDPGWHHSGADELWLARAILLGGALVLSLLVVSIGLALAAAEGRDERDTFAVVGAPPASMRRQAAARAAVLALVGIGLGIVPGYAPTWVVDRVMTSADGRYDVPVRFPWLVVAALVVVVPAVCAGGAWAASGLAQRFRPASLMRRD